MGSITVTDGHFTQEQLDELELGTNYALHVRGFYPSEWCRKITPLILARGIGAYDHDTIGPDGQIVTHDYGVDYMTGLPPLSKALTNNEVYNAYANEALGFEDHYTALNREVYERFAVPNSSRPLDRPVLPREHLLHAFYNAGITTEIPEINYDEPSVDPALLSISDRYRRTPHDLSLKIRAGMFRITRPNAAVMEEHPHMDTLDLYFNDCSQIGANIYLQMPEQGGEVVIYDVPHAFQAEDVKAVEADKEAFTRIIENSEAQIIRPEEGDLVLINTRVPHAVIAYQDPSRLRVSFNMFLASRWTPNIPATHPQAGARDPDFFVFS